MAHEHDHGSAGQARGSGSHSHSHAISADSDSRWLIVALLINLAYMVVEVIIGLVANSLALLSDAAHMLTDAGSIGLALLALRLARRPPKGAYTFGFKRGEILSAQINGVSLFVLAGLIAVPAIGRLTNPPQIDGAFVLVTGLVGALANAAAAWALSRATRDSLNVKGAALHNLFDLFSSLAAALAGLLVLVAGFDAADSLAALTVAALMLYGGWGLVRDSGRILLEAAPKGVDPDEIGAAMAAVSGVTEVHDLHVWEVTSGFPALAAHVLVKPGDDCHGCRRQLETMIRERFAIEHTTLQVDHEPGGQTLLRIHDEPRP